MRILICDDDSLMLQEIEKHIKFYFDKNHLKYPEICTFTNGKDLLDDTGEQDIVFLDIEMPSMNGIYVGTELKKKNKDMIIFIVTSYCEYLDEAMRFHVFRYLSKPLDWQRFYRNIHDAIVCYNNKNIRIPVETKEGVFTIFASDIVAVEAVSRKVVIHTVKQDFISTHTMSYWSKVLPENCFFQTHRSFIVNFEHVNDFDHTTIHMVNKQVTAYLTRRKYTEFKNAYLLYIESTR